MSESKNSLDHLNIPIKELPGGHHLTLNTFRIRGNKPGPHVHIQANVHGAELQGNVVIFHLLNYFKNNNFNGVVTFVPHANPISESQKMGTYTYGRFNPITGDNWNRLYVNLFDHPKSVIGHSLEEFASEHKDSDWDFVKQEFKKLISSGLNNLEKHFAARGLSENKKLFLILQKLACPADIVLDLHTGPKAVRYLYSAEYQKESAPHFHFPHVLNIPNEFAGAMDEATFINWVRLSRAFKEIGRDVPMDFEGYTVELGSEETISIDEGEKDALSILHYLKYKGVLNDVPRRLPNAVQKHCFLKDYKTYYAPQAGLVEFTSSPGDVVKKGSPLYRILSLQNIDKDNVEKALSTVSAVEDCIVINHIPSSNVGEGAELYQVMENSWDVTPE